MKILVYDIAAEFGGAISILKMYYQQALIDKNNDWVFIVSNKNYLPSNERIIVEEHSFPKKSWFHRLWFDKFKIKKIVKKHNPELIYNLQNVYIKIKNVKQILYMHQPIPFSNFKVSIFDFKIWMYKHVISKMIYKSIKKCDEVIVQTNWLKDAILKKVKVDEKKIMILPITNYYEIKKFYNSENNIGFFYPASSIKYKDHMSIFKACVELKKNNIEYKVFVTISDNENKLAKKLLRYVDKHKLNVVFLGRITQEIVFDYYSKTTLLFPSYLETFGLPLLEAKNVKSPIISANTPFAKEILGDYVASYFEIKDYKSLANYMKEYIINKK